MIWRRITCSWTTVDVILEYQHGLATITHVQWDKGWMWDTKPVIHYSSSHQQVKQCMSSSSHIPGSILHTQSKKLDTWNSQIRRIKSLGLDKMIMSKNAFASNVCTFTYLTSPFVHAVYIQAIRITIHKCNNWKCSILHWHVLDHMTSGKILHHHS